MGKPIVMGRKTYDSIGRPLPGRPNLVVTRNADFTADGIEVFHSLEEAVEGAKWFGGDETFIIDVRDWYFRHESRRRRRLPSRRLLAAQTRAVC